MEKEHPSIADSIEEISIWPLGSPLGESWGLAARDSSLFSLHQNSLVKTQLVAPAEKLSYQRQSVELSGHKVGPMLSDSLVWVADEQGLKAFETSSLKERFIIKWTKEFYPTDMAMCGDLDGDGKGEVAVIANDGRLGIFYSQSHNLSVFPSMGNHTDFNDVHFNLACTDFNRNGRPEAFILGDKGTAWFVNLKTKKRQAMIRNYDCGIQSENPKIPGEISPITLAEINGDGYPEAIFLGRNNLYAVDSNGVPLAGFPVLLSKNLPEELLYSTPLAADVNGDGFLEILVPLSTGKVLAVDHQGKLLKDKWPRSVGFTAYDSIYQPLSLWGFPGTDKNLLLYGGQRDFVNAQNIAEYRNHPGQWLDYKGGAERQSWLDPKKLSARKVQKSTKSIDEFMIFPNPVRQGKAQVRYSLGTVAQKAVLKLFDIAGNEVLKVDLHGLGKGYNEQYLGEIKALGSDVYSVLLEVWFEGEKKQKWDRIAVVR